MPATKGPSGLASQWHGMYPPDLNGTLLAPSAKTLSFQTWASMWLSGTGLKRASGVAAVAGSQRSYLLGVSPSHILWKRIDGAPRRVQVERSPYIMKTLPWKRMEVGSNGAWRRDRDWVRDPLAYFVHPGWERWLLSGRSMVDSDEYIYYRAFVPGGTSLAALARTASTNLAVEEGLERAKDEGGLDQYEVRRWDAWYRHVTLCLLAQAALQVARTRVLGNWNARDTF
jgi:hypothetical protein